MSAECMRIVHTSDWHVGRRFERESLQADQRTFFEWLAGQVEEQGVDLVVAAGDVYDRALPAEDAVALLDDALDALRGAGATVVLISGNHDSPRRLGFGARRQALGGVHVFSDDQGPPVPWIFEAHGVQVALLAVPFLDPLVCPAPQVAGDGSPRPRTHENVLADALDAGRRALGDLAPMPTVAVAHAYVAGASPSDSEKVLAVGGTDAVAGSVFEGFDYVALGHLHRPQAVGGDDRIAYSGSPLPYSFSEDHPKSVRLLELTGEGVREVHELPVPVGRPVVTLEGTIDSLLTDPAHERFVGHWVAARLTDPTVQVQPMERLRRRYPFAVSVCYARPLLGGVLTPHQPTSASQRSPEDTVLSFLAELCQRPAEEWERDLVGEALEAAIRDAAS